MRPCHPSCYIRRTPRPVPLLLSGSGKLGKGKCLLEMLPSRMVFDVDWCLDGCYGSTFLCTLSCFAHTPPLPRCHPDVPFPPRAIYNCYSVAAQFTTSFAAISSSLSAFRS